MQYQEQIIFELEQSNVSVCEVNQSGFVIKRRASSSKHILGQEHTLLEYLHNQGIGCHQSVPTIDGRYSVEYEDFLYTFYTRIDGRGITPDDINNHPDLLSNIGGWLARLNINLSSYRHINPIQNNRGLTLQQEIQQFKQWILTGEIADQILTDVDWNLFIDHLT